MNKLIKNVIKYNENKSDFLFSKIIEELKVVTDFYCRGVCEIDRDDFKQEVLFSISKAISNFTIFERKRNLNNDYNQVLDEYKEKSKSVYFKKFKEKYNLKELSYDNCEIEKINIILDEFYLFCSECQFRKYISLLCRNRLVDYYRKWVNIKKTIISLNERINNGDELIDLIPDKKDYPEYNKRQMVLSDEENKFLDFFIEKNRILTEYELGQKLGVSQQAISKKLTKIKKKLNN